MTREAGGRSRITLEASFGVFEDKTSKQETPWILDSQAGLILKIYIYINIYIYIQRIQKKTTVEELIHVSPTKNEYLFSCYTVNY